MTKPDYPSVVKALDCADEILEKSEDLLISFGFEPYQIRQNIAEAIPIARSMVKKLERYDELVEAAKKVPLGDEYGNLQPWEHDLFDALQNLERDCPAGIKTMLENRT